jgi:lipid-A-disaccharide synthase
MLIAGEPSGDLLAAELVKALRSALIEKQSQPTTDVQPLQTELAPQFFGAGGTKMAEAGVALAFDMTQHSVIGLFEVIRNYGKFKRLFNELLQLAIQRQPDIIVCVDFSGFNRRFAHAIKAYVRAHRGPFHNWSPRIVQFVSPQVWASRPGRARAMARDFDLLLAIFPFEKEWYAKRVPGFRVEFVGHPIVERHADFKFPLSAVEAAEKPLSVLLLPGSRAGELKRHLPVMLGALERIQAAKPGIAVRMVLPNESLAAMARTFSPPAGLQIQIGSLSEALAESTVAIASTGTVTLECAWFGVPTVALYKTSWSTYQIGRRIIQVKYLAMPNLLANEVLFPELIQHDATADNIARATLELLNDPARRKSIREKLARLRQTLGGSGASQRAAQIILSRNHAVEKGVNHGWTRMDTDKNGIRTKSTD